MDKIKNDIRYFTTRWQFVLGLTFFLHVQEASSQFREDFNGKTSAFHTNGLPGWSAITEDGEPVFMQRINHKPYQWK